MDYTLWDAIVQWFDGKPFNPLADTLYGLKFLWVDRWATVLQFIGGFTIISEIIGKDKVDNYYQRIKDAIEFKTLLTQTQNVYIFSYNQLIAFVSKTLIFTKLIRIKGRFADYREHVENTRNSPDKNMFTKTYTLWRKKRKKARRHLNRKVHLQFTLITAIGILVLYKYTCQALSLQEYSSRLSTLSDNWLFNGIDYLLYGGDEEGGIVGIILMILFSILVMVLNPITVFLLSVIRLLFLIIIEFIIIPPILGYLILSKNEKELKMYAFLIIATGFFFDFLCS